MTLKSKEKIKVITQKLRKDSLGIEGTYRNAKHHAQPCLPFISVLEQNVESFGFVKWQQGNNIHIFHTGDGRRFDMVPYSDGTGYVGIQYRLRESRSKAHPIATLTNMAYLDEFLHTVRCTARTHAPNTIRHNLSNANKKEES